MRVTQLPAALTSRGRLSPLSFPIPHGPHATDSAGAILGTTAVQACIDQRRQHGWLLDGSRAVEQPPTEVLLTSVPKRPPPAEALNEPYAFYGDEPRSAQSEPAPKRHVPLRLRHKCLQQAMEVPRRNSHDQGRASLT